MQQIEFECPKCQAIYEPEYHLTVILLFQDNDYNHIRTRCPICEHRLVLFFDNPGFLLLGYNTMRMQDVPNDIREVYDAAMFNPKGRPEPEGDEPEADDYAAVRQRVGELNPRQEAEIAALGSFLDGAPDSVDLVDLLFASPPPKSDKPHNWR